MIHYIYMNQTMLRKILIVLLNYFVAIHLIFLRNHPNYLAYAFAEISVAIAINIAIICYFKKKKEQIATTPIIAVNSDPISEGNLLVESINREILIIDGLRKLASEKNEEAIKVLGSIKTKKKQLKTKIKK